MSHLPQFSRPTFDTAIAEWKKLLAARGFPTELVWIFDENLMFEKDPAAGGFKLAFQTRITPPPADSDRIAFGHFCDYEARIAFYRIGSSGGKSVCLMLCDSWFEAKTDKDGYLRRDDWLMSFHPGAAVDLEETADEQRWRQRIIRNRPLHDLDFSMTLRAIHEILAHGRVLTTYEHYALRVLHGWSRLMGQNP